MQNPEKTVEDSNSLNCYLDDPKIDLVPENHHFVGQCICCLCTCGQHICPAQKNTASAKSAFKTHYRSSYPKYEQVTPPKGFYPKETRSISKSRDWATISRRDFTDPGTVKADRHERPHSKSPLKFVSTSVYTREYPYWNQASLPILKAPQFTHILPDIKFSAPSTYSQDFARAQTPTPDLKHGYGKSHMGKVLGTSDLLAINSTSRKDFPKYSSYASAALIKRPQEQTVTVSAPNHFTTTSGYDYISSLPRKNPMLLRKLVKQ